MDMNQLSMIFVAISAMSSFFIGIEYVVALVFGVIWLNRARQRSIFMLCGILALIATAAAGMLIPLVGMMLMGGHSSPNPIVSFFSCLPVTLLHSLAIVLILLSITSKSRQAVGS